jgi:hypothetical protein
VTADPVRAQVAKLAKEFARERRECQSRRELLRTDFDRLRDAGFLLTAVPRDEGLSHLRPAWGVAYERLLDGSWALPG